MSVKGHFNILVVDDFEEILEYLVLILSENVEYARISTATDGKEALDLCRKEKFDLIITDFKMPYINGYEFANFIRNEEGSLNKCSPVIFVSGFLPELKSNSDLGDQTSYLSKPIDVEELVEHIDNFLKIDSQKSKSA